jgi:hypothetical protein
MRIETRSDAAVAARRPRRTSLAALSLPGSLFALAIALRIGAVFASRGGPGGNVGYDPGVYYAAADAFTHGRLPYRDFVLLHPPGLMLVLTPFAALGRASDDFAGFVTANTAFAGLGACNAVLVYFVARRMGLSTTACWLGGAFYAVWYGAVYAELATRLEPLGSFAFLLGMLALTKAGAARRDAVLAGVAFGFALSVKLWWVVPLGIVLIWLARTRVGLRRAGAVAVGAAAVAVVVDAPFFALAPAAMWRMLVLDQLGRRSHVGHLARLAQLSLLDASGHALRGNERLAAAAIFAAVFAAVCVAAWRVAAARVLVLIALAQLAVLLVSPPFFHFYFDYLTPALALVISAAAHAERARVRDRLGTAAVAALVAGAALLTTAGVLLRPVGFIEPFPNDTLADHLPRVRCVMSDFPIVLIELDRLSSDLADHCPNWVDVTGRSFDVDASHGRRYLNREHNGKWQSDIRGYLLSGNAAILMGDAGSLDAATLDAVRDHPLLVRTGTYSIYRTSR